MIHQTPHHPSITSLIRRYRRFIVAFFTINFLSSLVVPTVSWALTSGPTTPEVTSFEPIDTTDMVNLLTGDLAYNVPLLEVPGPNGGYPISMSYHAGIMPNEEASWVGLGWTLNPGAITRDVRGYADDHKDALNTERFFWEGGQRTTVNIGGTVGIAGIAGLSAGLSLGHDTYQGFGLGISTGINFGIGGTDSPLGVGINGGIDPWGNPYASAGLAVGSGNQDNPISVSGSVGISTNFNNAQGYAGGGVGVSYGSPIGDQTTLNRGGASLVGASIATGGTRPSLALGGASVSGYNSRAGQISTNGFGFTLPIPFVNLGFKYQRYWIDETENVTTNGALYFETDSTNIQLSDLDYEDFDAYSLPETDGDLFREVNPIAELGGSFPNVDYYNVNAQGITGNIAPHYYQQHLQRRNVFRSNDGDIDRQVTHYPTGVNSGQIGFRFINDFSNTYQYNPNDFNPSPVVDPRPLFFDFDWRSASHGENDADGFVNNKLIGSKHIRTLTNGNILAYQNHGSSIGKGFLECNATGFTRDEDQYSIGAFIVTNASGVRYHFALPAYIHDEYRYSENIYAGSGDTFNESKVDEPYAYTWHLTAITGPDFVDRGRPGGQPNGRLDENDWGYWVEFEYGLWTDQYYWRTPGSGMAKDLDNNFQGYSEGRKEIYYLDAIRTKTHTAFFIKDIRNDGKSALNGKFLQNADGTAAVFGRSKSGGFEPIKDEIDFGIVEYPRSMKPVSQLKLSSIHLIPNSFNQEPNKGFSNTSANSFDQTFPIHIVNNGTLDVPQHFDLNVLDINDDMQVDMATRSVHLATDYSLVPGTSNSYPFHLIEDYFATNPPTEIVADSLTGKLTLNKLHFLGKGGDINNPTVPPMRFEYGEEAPVNPVADISRLSNENTYQISFVNNAQVHIGDIIRTKDSVTYIEDGNSKISNAQFFTVIDSISPVSYTARYIGPGSPKGDVGLIIDNVELTITKNAPYNREAYDIWGMYKSDIDGSLCEYNENLGRSVSKVSAESMDVWSLSKVTTQMGSNIKIQYASDGYSQAPLILKPSLPIDTTTNDQANGRLTLTLENVDVINAFDHLDTLDILIAYKNEVSATSGPGDPLGECSGIYNTPFYSVSRAKWAIVNIPSVSTIVVENQSEVQKFYSSNTFSEITGDRTCIVTHQGVGAVGGNVFFEREESEIFGGGIRVEQVAVEDPLTRTTTATSYDYSRSGVTPYEPVNIPGNNNSNRQANRILTQELAKDFSKLLTISRELPAPGVMYSTVTTQSSVVKNGDYSEVPGYSTYEFQVMEPGLVGIEELHAESTSTFNPPAGVHPAGWGIPYPPMGTLLQEQVGTDGDGLPIFEVGTYPSVDVSTRSVSLKDYTSRIGELKSITLYSSKGEKLSETINHYLHDQVNTTGLVTEDQFFRANINQYEPDLSIFNDQGVLEETFVDARYVKEDKKTDLLGVIAKRERFPSIFLGQTNTNYKTGITTRNETLAFDFYSGQQTVTYTENNYGKKFVTEVIPAYRMKRTANNRAYPLMNSPILEPENKNMLTQQGAALTYIMDDNFDVTIDDYSQFIDGLVSGEIQTWSDTIDIAVPGALVTTDSTFVKLDSIYRNHQRYAFIGLLANPLGKDGTYPIASYSDFKDNIRHHDSKPSLADGWQMQNEIAKYDVYSHALEAYDINRRKAATKMDINHEYVLATVANSSYDEFAYTGFEYPDVQRGTEYWFDGGVMVEESDIERSFDNAHTGMASLAVGVSQRGISYTIDSVKVGDYMVSVWVKSQFLSPITSDNFDIIYFKNGNSEPNFERAAKMPLKSANGWTLVRAAIPWQEEDSGPLRISFDPGIRVLIDDFRVHPIDATMTSYVYTLSGELCNVLDQNNIYTEYTYNNMGSLIAVKRETFDYGAKVTSRHDIHYSEIHKENKLNIQEEGQ